MTQFTVLFQSLHSTIALQPIVLDLVSEFCCSLVEVNSEFLTTLHEHEMAQLVSHMVQLI
jgi:hypothetical protein